MANMKKGIVYADDIVWHVKITKQFSTSKFPNKIVVWNS